MTTDPSAATLRQASRRAQSMPRSAIREIMALAAGRPEVIHLEVGEPDFTTPAAIVDGAFAAARGGFTKYTSNAGMPSLRAAIAGRVSTAWRRPVGPDRVVVTSGAIGGLFSALMAVIDPGDEVLIPDPGWPNYESICHLGGAVPVRYALPAGRGFLPDPAAIRRAVTPRTKALLINTPGNPSGAVFDRALVKALVDIAAETGIYLISDEIYEDIIFEGEHVSTGCFGRDDRVFVVSGFSKTYAMTGWRLGWLICPSALAGTAASLQEPVTSCPSSVSQKAGEAALAGSQDCVGDFRAAFRRRRDLLVDVFGNTSLLPSVPAGAFYGLIDISCTGLGSLDFAKKFLAERSVAVVPGITFGPNCDGFVRVAFTIEDARLHDGLTRLRNYIEESAKTR